MKKNPKFKIGQKVDVTGNAGTCTVTGVVQSDNSFYYNVKPLNRRGGKLPNEYYGVAETAIKEHTKKK